MTSWYWISLVYSLWKNQQIIVTRWWWLFITGWSCKYKANSGRFCRCFVRSWASCGSYKTGYQTKNCTSCIDWFTVSQSTCQTSYRGWWSWGCGEMFSVNLRIVAFYVDEMLEFFGVFKDSTYHLISLFSCLFLQERKCLPVGSGLVFVGCLPTT